MQHRRWTRLARVLAAGVVAAGLGVAAGAGTPAAAATPDGYGFAFLNAPSQPLNVAFFPDPAHRFVTSGGAAMIVRTGFGQYSVFFPGIAAAAGVAHVTAVNDGPVWCQVAAYGPTGMGERVDVRCYLLPGALQDSQFSVLFSTSSAPPAVPGQYGYLLANAGGAVVNSYNSAGAANMIGHVAGSGLYTVRLNALGSPMIQAGSLQVTAVSAVAAHCKVFRWAPGPAGQTVTVLCFNGFGTLTDNGFTLSYQRKRAISGAIAPPNRFGYILDSPTQIPPTETNFNSFLGFDMNTAFAAGAGLRFITFPAIGQLRDHVQVTAYGPTPAFPGSLSGFCGLLTLWTTANGNAFVRDVVCFNGLTGARLTQESLVTYTSEA
jgi:hypothetical protein